MEHTSNRAELRGRFVTLPALSHENHGRKFYTFLLEVDRLSGATDTVRVIVPEDVLHSAELSGGDMVTVRGQIRSHNSHTTGTRKLHIFVYATAMDTSCAEAINDVTLCGTICKPPILRRTPLGREICDVMLAVNRAYHRTDYLPCIFWGRTAQQIAALSVGSKIELLGRLQSREYIKMLEHGSERRTAYEISVLSAQVLENIEELALC